MSVLCRHCHRPLFYLSGGPYVHDDGPHRGMEVCAPEDTGKPWGTCYAEPEEEKLS